VSDLKILLWDTEFTPMQGFFWSLYPERIPLTMVDTHQEMLCFGTKWLGKRTEVVDRRVGKKEMLLRLREKMTEADVVVSWNGQNYDTKMVQTEFIRAGLTPPAPHKEVDLMRISKTRFKFASNKLDYVAEQLTGKKKLPTDFDLWRGVMANEEKSWKKMVSYQRRDVDLLEELWQHFLPWIKMPHPISAGEDKCRNCASYNLIRQGTALSLQGRYQKYQCRDCGAWSRGTTRITETNLHNIA
jgi:hypothetical protein